MQNSTQSKTKWLILGLSVITNAIIMAMPAMAMSVLFEEIAADLGLTLVQVGTLWGIGSLPTIATTLLSGFIIDRVGPKRIILIGSLVSSLFLVLRGVSVNFTMLLLTVVFTGILMPLVSMSNLKLARTWFPPKQMGLASGFLSMGMALGFLIGSMISATLLSPWLGGWRNVFYFFGAISVLLSLFWLFIPAHAPNAPANAVGQSLSIGAAIKRVASIRTVWLLGLAGLSVSAVVQSMLGYLPLFLRGQGWVDVQADGALATFHAVSLACSLPLAFLSDRVRQRKHVLLFMASMIVLGIGMLSFVKGGWVWVAVIIAGFVRDGYMAVFLSMVMDAKGVGAAFAATAAGFTFLFSSLGQFVWPIVGNSLAERGAGLPFVFWAGLGVLGLVAIALIKEPDQRFSAAPDVVVEFE